MPVLTIDGRKIETQPGRTIIEAALDNGISIPHFCWHPSLSVAGNCRMCLVNVGSPKKSQDGQVEVDANGKEVVAWMPKLQIACATPVSDGMIVSTTDTKTVNATNAVMEFLLINHPLDCPICDEAGQCKLQEYAYTYSKGESRFDDLKNHKDKRVAWGPNVLFDAERCISCSRCIRYADEVAHQPVLTFVDRGDHVSIETFPGTQFDSPYSMNVIELCPVGALTSIDFRFKARVWDMSFNESICPGCARGCNMQIGVRDNTILRLEPRANPFVNQYWMCDEGRLTQFSWVNEQRLSGVRRKINGQSQVVDWSAAAEHCAEVLKSVSPAGIVFLIGANATTEDAFAAVLLSRRLSSRMPFYLRNEDAAFADTFLRCADRNANSKGCEALGCEAITSADLKKLLRDGKTELVIALGSDLHTADDELRTALSSIKHLIISATNENQTVNSADVVFAAATYAEAEGTYVNYAQRVQHFTPAVVTR